MPRTRFAKHPFKGRVRPKVGDPRPVTELIRNKWYPFNVKKVKRGVNNHTRPRQGLVPGKVVILLTGPYRGRRVIFLKQMKKSGLLLVNGPFSVNGVPLRRVSQRFVIITSTRVNVSGVDTTKVTDDYFRLSKDQKKKKGARAKLPADKKATQKAMDEQLSAAIDKKDLMRHYLRSYFTITPGAPPHAVKF